jgi:hypothetical protein
MASVLCMLFIIAWFIFAGWLLVTHPDLFFKVHDMSKQNV